MKQKYTVTYGGQQTFEAESESEALTQFREWCFQKLIAKDFGIATPLHYAVDVVPAPEWRREGDKFRARWKELFPNTTEQEFLLLDNCAGLQLLKEDDDEVTFFVPGEAIGLDKKITVEVVVSKEAGGDGVDFQSNLEHESGSDGCGEGCPACEDEKNMRQIQVTFDHGNDAGGGRSDKETFFRPEQLAEWFREQIG